MLHACLSLILVAAILHLSECSFLVALNPELQTECILVILYKKSLAVRWAYCLRQKYMIKRIRGCVTCKKSPVLK